jgi:hypothetical protein
VNYGTTAAYGSQSSLNSSLGLYHVVPLTGLNPGTTYNYSAVSTNASGVTSISANVSFTTTGTPSLAISAVAVAGITSTSATITWITGSPSTSQVNFGTTPAYGAQSSLNSSLLTSHSVTLTGLTPGTTYNYAVSSATPAGSSAVSTNFVFSTSSSAGSTVPVISAVSVTGVTSNSATVTWTTSQPSTTQVNYGPTVPYASQTPLASALVTSHTVTLTGLIAGTTYNYAVISTNGAGIAFSSANPSFTTASALPPSISSVTVTGITATSAVITWVTDQNSSTRVAYGTTAAYGSQSALDSTMVTVHSAALTGLTPGTSYNFAALSVNGSGGSASSANLTFITTAPATGASPAISNVAFWGVTGSGVTTSWSTDKLSDTAVEYGVTTALGQTSVVQSALTSSHGVTLSGLSGNTTYFFRARSTSSAGTAYSGIYSFTTLDMAGPLVSNILVIAESGNAAIVTWTVSKPATVQVEYGLDQNYGRWTPPISGLQTALGWVPSGTIHYRFHCVDAAGNQTVSGDYTFIEP